MATCAINISKTNSDLREPKPKNQEQKSNDSSKYSTIPLWDNEAIQKVFCGLSLSDTANVNLDYLYRNDDSGDVSTQVLPEELVVAEKMSCSVCNVTFAERTDQLLHFKLDWHCENLKRKSENKEPLARELFALDDQDSTERDAELDNDSSKSDSSKEDEVIPVTSQQESAPLETLRQQFNWHSKLFFENGRGDILAIYKCLVLSYKETTLTALEMVKRTLLLPNQPKWAVLLLGSGHFAAAIYNGDQVVVHKTIHRYVTRAKQGTSQGLHDHHSKHAKSAGANLRRHNEIALIENIQGLLSSWEDELNRCHLIFYKVSARNRSSLFGGKNPPLKRLDLRLRSVPFQTKKPTFKETEAVRRKLSTLEYFGNKNNWMERIPCRLPKRLATSENLLQKENRVVISKSSSRRKKKKKEKDGDGQKASASTINEERQLRSSKARQHSPQGSSASSVDSLENDENEVILEFEQQTMMTSDLDPFGGVNLTPKEHDKKKAKPNKKVSSVKKSGRDPNELDKDEEVLRDALYTACCMNNLEKVKLLLNCADEQPPAESVARDSGRTTVVLNSKFGREQKSLLHVVSKSGFKLILRILLEHDADPCVANGKGQLPYTLATDRETRNTYRRFRAAFPDRYDYGTAQVPGALTEEIEQLKLEKRRLQRKQKQARLIESKVEQKEKSDFLQLAEPQKVKAVCELSVKLRCFQCGELMKQKIPFEYLSYKFCTVQCVKLHRQGLKS